MVDMRAPVRGEPERAAAWSANRWRIRRRALLPSACHDDGDQRHQDHRHGADDQVGDRLGGVVVDAGLGQQVVEPATSLRRSLPPGDVGLPTDGRVMPGILSRQTAPL